MCSQYFIAIISLAVICHHEGSTINLNDYCPDNVSVYYLTGAEGDTPHPVLNLSHYAGNCSQIVLMKNEYILMEKVYLQQVKFFSIIGHTKLNNSVKIWCKSDSGVIFRNSFEISLENLHFVHCSVTVSSLLNRSITSSIIPLKASVFFLNTSSIRLTQCLFSNHVGYALVIVNETEMIEIKQSNFTGDVTSISEVMHQTGGIIIWLDQKCSSQIQFLSCLFVNNRGGLQNNGHDLSLQGGALSMVSSTSSDCSVNVKISRCIFINNVANYGGALNIILHGSAATSEVNISIESSKFTSNSARQQGGAVQALFDTGAVNLSVHSCTFTNNSAVIGGGVTVSAPYIHNADCVKVYFINCSWIGNSAEVAGFAIELNGVTTDVATMIDTSSTIQVCVENCSFLYNKATFQYRGNGAMSVTTGEVYIGAGSTIFEGNEGTALCLRTTSILKIHGNLTFSHNTGLIGGAVLLHDHTQMYIYTTSNILFANNSALIMGGAIYSKVSGKTHCVFAFSNNSSKNYSVVFNNNRANQLNQSLFIQNTEGCLNNRNILTDIFKYCPASNTNIFLPLTNISFLITKSAIGQGSRLVEVMPGEHFSLVIQTIQDRFGSALVNELNHLWVRVASNDKNFKYKMSNNADTVDIFSAYNQFYVEGPNILAKVNFEIDSYVHEISTYHVGHALMSLNIIPCRLGYSYSMKNKTCICASQKSDKIQCPNDRQKLCLRYRYWYSRVFESAVPCPAQNCLYMYGQCPENTEVCVGYSKLYCSIRDTDDVCWDGRGGVLCSECAHNYSFTFRAFQCAKTSTCNPQNTFFVLLILFIYWGIYALAIIAVLSLNLRIGSGFMYGIVYYFSVVSIYTSSNPLFSDLWLRLLIYISIAITQLDPELLGYAVRVCFIQSWTNPLPHQLFHYTTPVFVTLLIISYIMISRYFRLPKRLSLANTSPIHAICMLILFSYTSLCLTNFKILIPISLFGELKVRTAPIIEYFGESHLPYAVIALLVELFLAIPMCILFLFAPCISNRINLVKYKLKPILDEFQACYHPNRRWFAGYYFVARQFVYLIDGVAYESFPQHNSILLSINILILLLHILFQPYQKKWINVLDSILLLDIVFLSTYSISLPNNDTLHVNQVIHDNVIPSLLILIPTLYLLVICLIGIFLVLKKCVLNCHCSSSIRTRALKSSFTKSFVHVTNEGMEGEFYYLADDFHCRQPEIDD